MRGLTGRCGDRVLEGQKITWHAPILDPAPFCGVGAAARSLAGWRTLGKDDPGQLFGGVGVTTGEFSARVVVAAQKGMRD